MSSDAKLKISFVGDSGVGKSCIVARLRDNSFNDNSKPTIGMDRLESSKDTPNYKKVQFLIWDSSGLERFRGMFPFYYKGAKAILIVFDTSNKFSFQSLDKYRDEINSFTNLESLIYVCGNKRDKVSERDVPPRDVIEDLVRKMKIKRYFEVSAMENANKEIEKMFLQILDDVMEVDEWKKRESPLDGIKLHEQNALMKNQNNDSSKGCV